MDLLGILTGILATIAIIAPIPLAVLADRQARVFQAEAFGHFQTAARRLRFVGWAFFAIQYLAVLLIGLLQGAVSGMFHYPPSGLALGMYGLMGAVVLVYTFALGVSRALYRVTVPDATRSTQTHSGPSNDME